MTGIVARCSGRPVAGLALLALAMMALDLGTARAAEQNPIAACWEVDAEQRVQKRRDASVAEAAQEDLILYAGFPCDKKMRAAIDACLAKAGADGDKLPCIGVAAAPCLASTWATTDLRKAACHRWEASAWIDIALSVSEALHPRLSDDLKAQSTRMWQRYDPYRDQVCALFGRAFRDREPRAHAELCRLHMIARHAIDLEDLHAEATAENTGEGAGTAKPPAPPLADRDRPIPPKEASPPPAPAPAPAASPAWGALAFTASGAFASAWRYPSKAEAEAKVLKDCARFGAGACEVIAFDGRLCGALASYAGRRVRFAYTGGGTSVAEAQQSALKRCNGDRRAKGDCRLRTVVCGDGR